ncbi:transposase [Neorhizobium sp. NCHU2750]|nr:transposase [Neorhizobium sp. NCHU2750]
MPFENPVPTRATPAAPAALLADPARPSYPASLPARTVCRIVSQITAEMLGLLNDRVLVRRDRRRPACHVRQISMYVCHVALQMSFSDIGAAFGRDRTTVGHACHVVEDRRDDAAFDEFVSLIERLSTAVFRPTGLILPEFAMPEFSRSPFTRAEFAQQIARLDIAPTRSAAMQAPRKGDAASHARGRRGAGRDGVPEINPESGPEISPQSDADHDGALGHE